MISKIKDIVQISQKLDDINTKIDSNTENVEKHSTVLQGYKDDVADVKKELAASSKLMTNFSSQADGLLDEMGIVSNEMKKELYDFKLIKSELKSRLVAELVEVFREEMRSQTKQLEVDVKSYNQLKDELTRLTKQMQTIETELNKFKTISSSLKETDFELAKYAREIAQADKEKLNLMREVENLQRLLSKERRSRPR